jgi:hypothetical protein
MPVIDLELYNRFNDLGLIPNDVRTGNVGKSDYSKHLIQPWSIWIDYNLNPWDADIVKRVLRTKEEPGMSATEARIMDYKKIKHICDERIRQLELQMTGHVLPDDCMNFDVENLDEPTKELTIQDSEIMDIGRSLYGSEISKYIKFCNKHLICKEPVQVFLSNESGIGQSVKVKCPVCGEEEDITDVSKW